MDKKTKFSKPKQLTCKLQNKVKLSHSPSH